jgi:hypothetical protein
MSAFLDRELVEAFVRDELDSAAEQALAEQVARLLPFHWTLPNPLAASLSRLTSHLGGDAGLLTWLDRHPGHPRLTARLYRAIGLLDQVSAEPPVVAALSELRTHDPYPPGLEAHLVPRTSRETLASLSHAIESLLGEDRTAEAVALADATLAVLHRIAPCAAALDPRLEYLSGEAEQVRRAVRAAVDVT